MRGPAAPVGPNAETGTVADTQLVVGLTNYLGVLGTDMRRRNGVLYLDSAVRLPHVTDGTSNTLMIGERPPPPNHLCG